MRVRRARAGGGATAAAVGASFRIRGWAGRERPGGWRGGIVRLGRAGGRVAQGWGSDDVIRRDACITQ